MEKKITTVHIDKKVLDFAKKYKVNLSEWLNDEFTKQHLSLEAKKKALKKLEKEIKQIEARTEILSKALTQRELRYICQVTPRLKEGKNITAMWRRFNVEYNRKYTFNEFQALVSFYEKQAIERVRRAMINKKNEKQRDNNRKYLVANIYIKD